MENTDKFTCTIAVTEGYNHNNENKNMDFVSLLNSISEFVEKKTGIYISFVVNPSTIVYKKEWGCPEGGEFAYTISSIRNNKFNKDSKLWKDACIKIVYMLKYLLKQVSVSCEFSKIEMLWISDKS